MTKLDPFVFVPDGEPFLDFYRGTFDAVFLALHPFARIPDLDPLQCHYRTNVVLRSEMPDDADLIAYTDQLGIESSIGKPISANVVDERAKADGEIVSWRQIRRRCGFPDERAIDRALRTSIHGLRTEYADESSADALAAICAKERIFLPTEGSFQTVMERPLTELFTRAGCEQVVLGDEFGDNDIPVALEYLRGGTPWDAKPDWPQIYGVKRIYNADRSMIAVVPWDHFFTVIAVTADSASRLKVDELLEGFWCDASTTQGWFNDSAMPIVGP